MNIPLVGLILAGGRSLRMGGKEKAFLQLGGASLLGRAIDRLGPQCQTVLVNANDDPARFAEFGLTVVADSIEGHAGPLAGILAGLDWIADSAPGALLLSVPVDSPLFPRDLGQRLLAAIEENRAEIACAASVGRRHGVHALWSPTLRDGLRDDITRRGARKVEAWLAGRKLAVVEWPARPIDPFLNINAPADLAAAERLLAKAAD